ncbi:MAG: helix-turn-helix domain-containing protein [Ruminococcus sp.]|nr:helix-turn-helix domain-containing protein [Ruminococcus sp.]
MNKNSFGSTVRAKREELQMTQPELAERVGTSQSHVSRIEANQCVPSAVLLIRLAGALKMSAAELLEAAEIKTA